MFKYELVWCAGCENGCADWLSRAPLLDTYCPDDGELPKEKYCVDEAGNLQFIDSAERATKGVSSERRRRLEVASAESVGDRASRKPTVYSVCAGIGSCMQAIERFNISAKMIGCCEINDEISAELGAAFPHVPNHGDMRTVIAAMALLSKLIGQDRPPSARKSRKSKRTIMLCRMMCCFVEWSAMRK